MGGSTMAGQRRGGGGEAVSRREPRAALHPYQGPDYRVGNTGRREHGTRKTAEWRRVAVARSRPVALDRWGRASIRQGISLGGTRKSPRGQPGAVARVGIE